MKAGTVPSILTIELFFHEEGQFFQVDIYRNGKPVYDDCKSFDVDSENNQWDAFTSAKNYIADMVDKQKPQ